MAVLKLVSGEEVEVSKEGKVKKVGRPKGKWSGPKFRYRPVKWEVKFNQIVFDYLAISGITYEELGVKYGYCKEQIGNILNSPQADLIKQGINNSIISRNSESIPILFAAASEKVAQRIADFVSDDNLYQANPFAFIDRAVRIGQSVGVLKKENERGGEGNSVTNNQINIGDSAIKELTKSLEIAKNLKVG